MIISIVAQIYQNDTICQLAIDLKLTRVRLHVSRFPRWLWSWGGHMGPETTACVDGPIPQTSCSPGPTRGHLSWVASKQLVCLRLCKETILKLKAKHGLQKKSRSSRYLKYFIVDTLRYFLVYSKWSVCIDCTLRFVWIFSSLELKQSKRRVSLFVSLCLSVQMYI